MKSSLKNQISKKTTSSLFKTVLGLSLSLLICWSIFSYASSYILDNLAITARKLRGADESWRVYTPKPVDNTVEYKPSKQTEAERKVQVAEAYVVKNYPQEYKVEKVEKKDSKGSWLKWPISTKTKKKKIIIHHTAESLVKIKTTEDEQKVLQAIYKYHTFSNAWGDIGYNYIIGPSGKIYDGRAWWPDAIGAHASWNNSESVGIALMGNFEIEEPTKEQITSLQNILVAVAHKYKINPYVDVTYHKFDAKLPSPYIRDLILDSIVWHTDVGNTACPGENLYKLLPNLKEYVAIQLGYIKPTLPEVKPSTISPLPSASGVTTFIPKSGARLVGTGPRIINTNKSRIDDIYFR